MAKKLTPKARVLRRWPGASAVSYAGPSWVIYTNEYINRSLNVFDKTPALAWAEAAKHATVRGVKNPTDRNAKR